MTAGKLERRNTSCLHLHPLLKALGAVQAHQKVKMKIPKGGLVREVERQEE